MAIARIVQEDIGFDAAILTDTARKSRVGQHRQKARRNVARRVIEKYMLVPDRPGEQMSKEVCGRADDNAVEVIRVALRLHQGLMAAFRTAIEIRPLRPLSGERCYDCLGFVGCFFEGSICVVNNLLRMAESKGRLSASLTAVIRRGGRVTPRNRVSEPAISDAPAETTATELLVFSIETSVRRDPDLEIDNRVICRCRGAGNSAELRESGIRGAASTT